MTSQESFTALKAAKETEIKAGQDQRDKKVQELADTDSHLAQAKQDLDDTRNSLDADQTFLMNLKETCAMTDQEYEARTKTRQEEIAACGEALNILDGDEAHDTFTKTFNFVQVAVSDRREKASALLSEAGKKFSNPRIAALSIRARLDAFADVIADIDNMNK